MVALLGLLDLGEVGVEVLLVEEGGAVDALEHLAVGLALPVGAGDRQQLERADLAGVGDVRAAAEVDELALAVEAEDAVLVQLVVDVLDLERLAEVVDELAGLGDGQAEPLERLGLLDDLGHLGLDGREVVLGERAVGEVDVVIEAGGGGRAEGELDAREEPHDRPGHDVRGRVPEDVERLAVPRGQEPELDRRRPSPSSSGRSRSTTAPSATAATAASASRLPIPSATSRGRTPSGYSLTDPSGSLIWTIDRVRRGAGLAARDGSGRPPPTHDAGAGIALGWLPDVARRVSRRGPSGRDGSGPGWAGRQYTREDLNL